VLFRSDTAISGTEAAAGYRGDGGGLYITNPSGQPTDISWLTIEDTKTTGYTSSGGSGGGAYINVTGALSITDTAVRRTETAGSGGGLYIYNTSGQPTDISRLTIEDTKTTGSSYTGDSGGGAYIFTMGGPLTIEDTTIKRTEAAGAGGGLHVSITSGQTDISGLIVETATAGSMYGGGGLCFISGSGSVTLTGCKFKDTHAMDGYSYGGGGAVYMVAQTATISDVEIENSSAKISGGGMRIQINHSGTLDITDYSSNNTEAFLSGGSLYIRAPLGGSISIRNSAIRNSRATNSSSEAFFPGGGGIYIDRTYDDQGGGPHNIDVSLLNVNFNNVHALGSANNTAGGAVSFGSGVHLIMEDCLIQNTEAAQYGGAIAGVGNAGTANGGNDSSSCELRAVGFTNFSAPQGSILYGTAGAGTGTAPAYTIRPGCSVGGTVITPVNYSTVLLPSMVYLPEGSITYVP
jgi:hypothetical protein